MAAPHASSAARAPGPSEGPARAGTTRSQSDRRVPQPSLGREAAERVLHRAVELVDEDAPSDGVPVQALVEAAEELGIDAGRVLRAVAEERLGLLEPGRPRLDAVLGPGTVMVTRLVAGSAADVRATADAWLRRDALRRTRDSGEWAEYRRRNDPWGSLQRTARSVQGERQLQRAQRVRLVTADVPPGRTLVALVVDAGASRAAAAAGGSAGAATAVGLAAANLLQAASLLRWLAVPAAGAAGAAAVVGRRAWVSGLDDELESLMDRVATGAPPGGVLDGLGDRLLRGARLGVRRG